ncbi:MAG: 50S ribosomal protein L32 [SAR202 cluster bacterium]|nr:50S ribosomal protein L32 [SAR202 cluster bacterium]
MPPLPKRKLSRSRQGKRMSHTAYVKPSLSRCSTCQSLKRPHVMCPICGHYDGREIKSIKTQSEEV